jgi:hypothetical protein
MIREFLKNTIFHFQKKKYIFTPIFIIGCGRSGTTILGETLSKHSEIKYLNERRDLWHKSYPQFNIWNQDTKNPQLFASNKDINNTKSSLLKKLFFREQVIGKSSVLLEKLPINNFRLDFLNSTFPNAKYIYLRRNGLEVSSSIEKQINKRNWFSGEKESLLKKYSEKINCKTEVETNFEKGMWEWKLSIDESNAFFNKLDNNKFIHLSYQDFIDNTYKELKSIFDFMNLQYSEEFLISISKDINRKNPSLSRIPNDNSEQIGGDILKQSINNTYIPF